MKSRFDKPEHKIRRLPNRKKRRYTSEDLDTRVYAWLSIVYLRETVRPLIEIVSGTPKEKSRPWLVVQSSVIDPMRGYREIMVLPLTTAKDGEQADKGTSIFVGKPNDSGLQNPSYAVCDKIIAIRRRHIQHVGGFIDRQDPAVGRINNALRLALGIA